MSKLILCAVLSGILLSASYGGYASNKSTNKIRKHTRKTPVPLEVINTPAQPNLSSQVAQSPVADRPQQAHLTGNATDSWQPYSYP